jgi:CheY-like chemotaxis protein/nitrogen-specific signal transduction histidine kinase
VFTARHELLVGGVAAQAAIAIDNARLFRRAQEQAQQLREIDRRKDEFLATLAHELRNPLAPIRNAIAILQNSDVDRAAIDQTRAMLERQVSHMVRLVDDLLDVSRITRGKIELRRQAVDLSSVVMHAVEIMRPACDAMEQELTVELPSEPIVVDADPIRLAQVVGNLLNNACKYTDRKGRVLLRVAADDKEAMITVRDTGIGITAEHLSAIFEMFSQPATAAGRAQGGLGIGLWLAKSLIELHGGRIEAFSEGAGRGAEFVVRVPLAAPAQAPLPSKTAPAAAAATADSEPRRRILVVDDNRDSLDSMVMLLRMSGHEVVTASDGEEALNTAAAHRPEVVLLDIGLPRLDGYEVARRLRREAWGGGLLLVAMTGWGQDQDRQRSLQAGFDAHLVKPADYQEVLAIIQKTTRLRRPSEL